MKRFLTDLSKYGMHTAVWNARFNLGYRIGGFTSAKR